MNLFELFVKIGADTSEADKAIGEQKKSISEYRSDVAKLAAQYRKSGMDSSEAMKKAYSEIDKSQYAIGESAKSTAGKVAGFWESAGKKIKSGAQTVAQKVESVFATAAKVGTAAIGAGAAAAGALVKQAVAAYGEYEQLVGGVETLFGDAAKNVQENAAKAFKTAGMSANDYMNTTIALSASLIQSLGGDTAKAAEIADLAITDMSDNVNKMGTSAEMVQNAYRGFVRQNFTMLDNLALGYGGTKEEMERLLADAEKISGVKYDISSLADMIQAIHVVQTEMDITGTTAKEAATTIQGSANSMKAAWKNLIVGVSDDNQDFDKLMDDFVDSVETAGDNMIPRVEKSLDGVAKLVEKGSEKIIPKAIQVITKNLPKFINAGAKIVTAIGQGITKNAPELLKAGTDALSSLIKTANVTAKGVLAEVKKSAPEIVSQIKDIATEADGTIVAVGGIAGAIKALAKGDYVGAAIGGVVAAIGLIKKASDDSKQAIKGLSDEEDLYLEKAKLAAESLDDLLEDRNNNITAVETETKATEKLWKELQTLTDEQGYVKDGAAARAEYILGELNKALGTEYEMNDNIIDQYGKMRDEIDKLILKKRAERLLEASAGAYDEAKANLAEYSSAAGLAAESLATAKKNLAALTEQAQKERHNPLAPIKYAVKITQARNAIKEAQAEYDKLSKNAATAAETVSAYEDAMLASSEQNYARVAEILERDTAYRWKHVGDIKKITDEEAEQLVSDWKNAERAASFYRSQYSKGAEGFTAETASELEGKADELKKLIDQYKGVLDVSAITEAGKRALESKLNATQAAKEDALPSQVTAFADDVATKIASQLKGLKVELDSGKLVGGITDEMDRTLGNKYAFRLRGAMA